MSIATWAGETCKGFSANAMDGIAVIQKMYMKQNILIIGEHPVKADILRQADSMGYRITCAGSVPDDVHLHEWHHIVLLPVAVGTEPSACDPMASDAASVLEVERLYEALRQGGGVRPVVHLMLRSAETLRLLRHREYKDDWHGVFELSVFTLDDVWAKNVLAPCGGEGSACGLDYRPVTFDSNQTVHLVVFGTSNFATALVENAALVAHYPNYIRDHSLRTRITVIDSGVSEWSRSFIGSHKPLMDNSYYRHIDLQARNYDLHRPMYEASREDFVDVEWEFVCGTLHDVVVQDKILGWAANEAQILSVALCHESDADNLAQMQLLTDLLAASEVPIYVKQRSAAFESIIAASPRLQRVVLIGMEDCGYDISLPLLPLAKRVKYVYDYCYDHNIVAETEGGVTAPSFIDSAEADAHWLQERKAVKRYSNVCNAMTLATKMRSLRSPQDGPLSAATIYAITQSEIEMIAEVEHNRWSVEELLQGFRPCTDEEQSAIENDITLKAAYKDRLVHYDLRAYRDLRPDATGQNVNTYDLCLSASIPLIASERE